LVKDLVHHPVTAHKEVLLHFPFLNSVDESMDGLPLYEIYQKLDKGLVCQLLNGCRELL
jgi:hypothetical protein